MTAMQQFESERARQIADEGWTAEHDDAHDGGELLRAGLCYYREAQGTNSYEKDGSPQGWPWAREWWKPRGAQSNLVRAGGLYFAEKDRLLRQSPNASVRHIEYRIRQAAQAFDAQASCG